MLLGLGADVRAAVPAIVDAGAASIVAIDDGHQVGARVSLGGAGDVVAGGIGRGGREGGRLDGTAPMVTVVDRSVGVAAGEVFVRSPGFPRRAPDLADALGRGALMTTPLDLWVGSAPGLDGPVGERSPRRWIGITGTKGKSTVTELCGVLARGGGVDVGVAGNVGIPVFADSWNATASLVVLEVSSYQAADLHHVPDVAVLTSLAEDHVSWHGGVDRYVADKLRLLVNEGGAAPVVVVAEVEQRARAAVAGLGIAATVVPDPSDVPDGIPVHRARNAALAAAALAAAGGPVVAPDDVLVAATSSLPGRLDRCPAGRPAAAGVWCIDDALASNPAATAAGLGWARGFGVPTVVVLGGVDRSVDPTPLVEEAARWVPGRLRAVTVPDNGEDLAACSHIERIGGAPDVAGAVDIGLRMLAASMDRTAVAAERPEGSARAGAGEGPRAILLFSPAAPTPPRHGTWSDRSSAFRAALQTS